jgi:hypothetical protein
VWGSVALLVLNDHLLKGSDGLSPAVTGKLSDLAGMCFFPLLMQAEVELILHRIGRPWGPSRRVLLGSAALCALFFAGIQLSAPLAQVWTHGLGLAQWPFHAAHAWTAGQALPTLMPVAHTADPTDILTTPAVGLAVWAGWRRSGLPSPPHDPPVRTST